MGRVLTTLAVIALVSSGCQFPASSDNTPTLTPAPVPSAQDAPPGISVLGSTLDPAALIDGHFAALSNQSFTVHSTITAQPIAGGPASVVNRIGYVSADPTRFFVESSYDGVVFSPLGPQRRLLWSNGSILHLAQYQGADLIRQSTFPPRERPPVDSQFRTYFRVVLDAVRMTGIERVNGGETLHYRLFAEERQSIPDRAIALQFSNVSGIHLQATVSGDGVIQEFRVRYEGDFRDQRYRIRRVVVLTDRANTTVPTPEWIDNPANTTNES